jgi:hypothetical protein
LSPVPWCGGGTVGDVPVGGRSMAHCWVLRQQAPGSPVDGGGGVLDLVPGAPPERDGWLRPPAPSSECGVCGLLFENCIVDASIFLNRCRCVRGRCCSLGGGGVRVVVVSCS